MKVIEWINAELQARRLANRELGDHMGWPSGMTSKILSGARELKADEFVEVLRFFGLPSPIGQGGETRAQMAARHVSALPPYQQDALLALVEAMRSPAR